jgi:type I restriction enzyme R subunit
MRCCSGSGRIHKVCADIARHFQEKVASSGFGAQVVTFDRESCVLYKKALDEYLPPEVSDIVMTVNSGETEYASFRRERETEEKLLDRFRDPADPLKILIVTEKLLTGFDAPILQVMYLTSRCAITLLPGHLPHQPPLRGGEDARPDRYSSASRRCGLAIQFDERASPVVANINELVGKLPGSAEVPGLLSRVSIAPSATRVDRGAGCLPNNDATVSLRSYSYLSRLWRRSHPIRSSASTRPTTVADARLRVGEAFHRNWQAPLARAGPKTIELIHQHVTSTPSAMTWRQLVLDADLLEALLGKPDPNQKAKVIEIMIARQLRKRLHDPRFKALGERLEALKQKHEQGLLLSIDFLKALLDLARDVVAAEHAAEPIGDEELGKAALTELFQEKNEKTPIMVERVVNDIDEIVRYVRFEGWQNTHAGEREVKMALRKTLFKYKLHQDQGLFDQAYGYIRQYY